MHRLSILGALDLEWPESVLFILRALTIFKIHNSGMLPEIKLETLGLS